MGHTNYNVADQLADVGMEAIHPKASNPIETAGINIRIKNTFEADHPGTLITKTYIGEKSKVEIIAGTDKVTALQEAQKAIRGTTRYSNPYYWSPFILIGDWE